MLCIKVYLYGIRLNELSLHDVQFPMSIDSVDEHVEEFQKRQRTRTENEPHQTANFAYCEITLSVCNITVLMDLMAY
jgi:hypothetical protein